MHHSSLVNWALEQIMQTHLAGNAEDQLREEKLASLPRAAHDTIESDVNIISSKKVLCAWISFKPYKTARTGGVAPVLLQKASEIIVSR